MNAYALLVLTTLFWAGNAIAGKLAVGLITPVELTFFRWLSASLLVFLFARRHLVEDWPVIRRHWPLLFALGALGFTGFNLALYAALGHTSAINVTIEQSCMPVLIILANFIFFRQRVAWIQGLGVVLTITGVVLTATRGTPLSIVESGVNRGDAIMMIGVLLYGGFTVALRYRPAMHWTSLMMSLAASAFVFAIPFYVAERLSAGPHLPGIAAWSIIAYTAIFPSLLSQAFFIRGVSMLGANRAGLFINLVPIFGSGLAVLLLGEHFRLYHLAGLVLVLGGIALAERFRHREVA